MSESINKNVPQGDVLKAFIENRYGSKVYEAYSAALDSGEIKSIDDAAGFLDRTARKIEGKLLTGPQLERHDEKAINEIRRLLGEKKGLEAAKYLEGKIAGLAKYFGVKTELDHEESKESGKRLTKNCVEDLLKEIRAKARVIALAVGYTQPEYIEGKGGIKKLNPKYFLGLIEHIKIHYSADAEKASKLIANVGLLEAEKNILVGEKESLEEQLAAANAEKERLNADNGRLAAELKELKEIYSAVNVFIDKAQAKINEQGGNTNGQ